MKKLILLIVLAALAVGTMNAQTDPDLEKYMRRRDGIKYPNVLKVNTLAIAFNNVSLAYERGLVPRLSLVLAAGYKYSGNLPSILNPESNLIQIKLDQIQGYSFAPELRYYVKSCDARILDGFYIGAYFRHSHYSTSAEFNYSPEDLPVEFYNADVAMNEYGVGISIGYQLMLWQRLSIDFMFFGPRYSNNHIGYEFDNNVSQEFLDDLSNHINEVLNKYGFDYTVDLKQDGENRASTSFSFANVKFGIGIGFAF